jgi:hypothetical protein
VLVRKQPFDLRVVEHGGEELRRDLAAQQPVAVLGEYGDIPNRIVDAESFPYQWYRITLRRQNRAIFPQPVREGSPAADTVASDVNGRFSSVSVTSIEPPDWCE